MKFLSFLVWAFIAFVVPTQASPTVFSREFAPSQGMVAPIEKPLRDEMCLNGRWQFQPVNIPNDWQRGKGNAPQLALPDASRWEKTPIKIPSPWNVNTWGNGRYVGAGTSRPYAADSVYYPSYPASWDGVQMGWLRRKFRVPATWNNRRLILHFEGVAGAVQVLVNGQKAGEHFDSFLPFDCDVTDLVKRNGDNELLVGVRKSSLFNIISAEYPEHQQRTYPNGSNMDELAGIWNDVFLFALPQVRVDDVFVKPLLDRKVLEIEVALRNDSPRAQTVKIGGDVRSWINLAGKDTLSAPEPKSRLGAPVLSVAFKNVVVPAKQKITVTLSAKVNNQLKNWSPDAPNLYSCVLQVLAGTQKLDVKATRFGWRQWKIVGRDLQLNGRKIQLTGDLLHPFGPFIGSRRYAWAWYKMVKDVGGNAVRPHAQPRPRHYLELADEMGICVLDEAAVFGSSINLNLKEDITWQRLNAHVDGLVKRDRNHPSVFGWSVANEMFALWFKTSEADKKSQFARLRQLALRPRKLDPTRDWISVDGDEDLGGVTPVWNKHFGIGVPKVPDLNKPLMVGEHGGTYYAAPSLLEPLIGERAYENYAARNEGLAVDLYQTITQLARPKLAFYSPSELAWFGLEQLPFGYSDTNRLPTRSDGIFFPNYVENKPGVQIERLPPYVMTLNPGFDANLPLYRPLPMFSAMKDALQNKPSQWSAPASTSNSRVHPVATNHIQNVAFAGDRNGALFASLFAMGVPLGESDATSDLLIIDGENLGATAVDALENRAVQVLARGGLVWIMARETGNSLPALKNLLGGDIQTTQRRASSLLRGANDAALDGFGLKSLYFAESSGDVYIQKAGLSGALVGRSRVLLRASETDWALWNGKGEVEKNGNILLYERLQKPAGASLIEVGRGSGRLWISTLDTRPNTPQFRAFWRQLLQNVGVKMGAPPVTSLVVTARDGEGAQWRYTTQKPDANWFNPDFDDQTWSTGRAGFGVQVPEGKPQTPWTTPDIWLRHTFDVQNLPTDLTLDIHHDEDVQVYLNGTLIFEENGHTSAYKHIELNQTALKTLKIGRNVLAVHCLQTAGGQYIDVGLSRSITPNTKRPHDLLLDGPLN